MPHHICCIIGTRPEVLKMAPVVKALQANPDFDVSLLLTGQHDELLDQASQLFQLPIVHNLKIMQHDQSLSDLSARLLEKMSAFFTEKKPDMIIAQGDTTTTFIAALTCFYLKIPFGYVESGLRSGNLYRPFPEEMNRQFASKIAVLNFAPTEISKQNLLDDRISPETIFVTGNTVIDTLLDFSKKNYPCPIQTPIQNKHKIILVTCHRRENFGQPFKQICAALNQIVKKHVDVEIVYPVHPNPQIKIPAFELLKHERIHLIEPVDYPNLVALMQHCYLIITDSGGLQEEAPTLKKPVLVMRTETERPEGLLAGAAKMVGIETDLIVDTASKLLTDQSEYQKMIVEKSPYGDGHASERIAVAIQQFFMK